MSDPKVRVLNSKERKRFYQQLGEQFGYEGKEGFAILFNEHKERYYFLTEEVLDFELKDFRIETIGLYVATKMQNGDFRLTIEGTQLLGPHCKEHILELDDEEYQLWIRGNDLAYEDTGYYGWLLITHKHANGDIDFAGSGKVVHKEEQGKTITTIHNYIPKSRYVRCA